MELLTLVVAAARFLEVVQCRSLYGSMEKKMDVQKEIEFLLQLDNRNTFCSKGRRDWILD